MLLVRMTTRQPTNRRHGLQQATALSHRLLRGSGGCDGLSAVAAAAARLVAMAACGKAVGGKAKAKAKAVAVAVAVAGFRFA